MGGNPRAAEVSRCPMQSRVTLWWVCVAFSGVGLLAFLLGDVLVTREGVGVTGYALLSELMARAFDTAWDAVRRIDVSRYVPDPEIWIGVGTLTVLGAPLALRGRPTTGLRRLMLLLTLGVVVALAATSWGLSRELSFRLGSAYWVWAASLVLLCLSPWLRRRDQLDVIACWERRPHPPNGDLPALASLPPEFAALVRETRAVRVSLDVLTGLDREARQLSWEWCRRLDDCAPADVALLQTLGLDAAPVRAILDGDAGTGPLALHQLDAALARFERALLEYRSWAFR